MADKGPGDRFLVICADDFAMDGGVSEAIVQLASQGRISATSAMVLSPRWPKDAQQLRPLRERIDVGLHLDWTSSFAIASGHGRPLARMMICTLARRLDRRAVRVQIDRQLDLFENNWGASPDHVDGHHHVQQFPVIRDALVDAIRSRYPAGQRPWLRVSAPTGSLKARVVADMGAMALARLARASGIAHSSVLAGVYDFRNGAGAFVDQLARGVVQPLPGTVMMCHPGLDIARENEPVSAARVWEHKILAGTEFAALLASGGVRLARGRDAFGAAC